MSITSTEERVHMQVSASQNCEVPVQCLASLANCYGVGAAIQFISITSTEQRAHMQVSPVTTVKEPFPS